MFVKEIHSKGESPLTGSIVFKQNQLSPLNVGTGTITVQQTVSSKKKEDISGTDGVVPETKYENIHKFAVNGPRFSLPIGAITSVFPPENAQGDYDKVLPHVCLNRSTIPWERSIVTPKLKAKLLKETPDQAPWLAILSVFDTDQAVRVSQIDLSGLIASAKTATNESNRLPDNYLHPYFELNPTAEKLTDKCLVVDIPVALFNTIAPTKQDLPWLAHVRQIQPSNTQSLRYLEHLKGISNEKTLPEIATVIGNRLPLPGGKTTAYLVSLEGWEDYLPNEESPSSKIAVNITHVRLVLLKQWDIYAIDRKESFLGYLTNLNQEEKKYTGNLLQLTADYEPGKAGDAINNAFKMGFAPLNHHTRSGDQTVSWYRGPFVPYDIKAGEVTFPVNGPDSATAYNPDTGMLDVSYAAAWQLGQLLALQNGNFAETLYNWKWSNTREAIAKFENEALTKSLQEIVNDKKPLTVLRSSTPHEISLHAQTNMLNMMNAGLSAILTGFMNNQDNYSDEN